MVVKYGVIGCGMIAQEHLRNLNLIDGVQATALADPVDDMLNQAAQIPDQKPQTFSDYKDMLAKAESDAYIIATPNYTHHQILRDVLHTNKPILVEKPLCITVEQCRDIFTAACRRESPVWVAMEYRFMPPVDRLRTQSLKPEFGKPLMMSIREHRFPFLQKVGDWNRFSHYTGGTLVEKCCHFWDLMRLILKSDPVRVYASGSMDVNHLEEEYDGNRPDIIDNAFAVVEFENGARGMLDLCMFSDSVPWQEEISITSSRGRLDAFIPASWEFRADPDDQEALVQYSDRETRDIAKETFHLQDDILRAGSHYGATYYQQVEFAEMVATGINKPKVSVADGFWAVAVGEAAEKSVRTKEAQFVEPL